MRRSILTEKVARRGYDIFREYAVDPLERFTVKDVFTVSGTTQDKTALAKGKIPTVFQEETCRVAADRMAEFDVAHLTVISHSDSKELGVVALADLLKARRFHSLEESHRETMFPLVKR
jgi:hypothetical protein